MGTSTRFEKEAKGNLEIAYSKRSYRERRLRKAEYFETERTKCVRNKEIRGKWLGRVFNMLVVFIK